MFLVPPPLYFHCAFAVMASLAKKSGGAKRRQAAHQPRSRQDPHHMTRGGWTTKRQTGLPGVAVLRHYGKNLRDDDAGEAAEVGVGGDELGLEDARRGVNDGVGAGEAMVEADIGGGERDGFVERDHLA